MFDGSGARKADCLRPQSGLPRSTTVINFESFVDRRICVSLGGQIKTAVRAATALFAALFGSLFVSVQTCSYAAQQAGSHPWADYFCGHNVLFFWLCTAPVLLVLSGIALAKRFARLRIYVVALLLAGYGVLRDA